MAVINKIRKHGGIITIIIGVSLASFVIGPKVSDYILKLFGKGEKGRVTIAGKVSGEKITWIDFEKKVAQQEEMMKQQTGKEMTAEEKYKLEDETWKNFVRDIVLGKECDELGLNVSTEELWELVQGKEPHQYILQNFADPQTGAFNPEQVRSFLKNLDQYEEKKPGTKAQWDNLEQLIRSDRLFNKYQNLVKGSYYITKAMLKDDYMNKTKKAVIQFFAEKYSNIPDAKVTLSADDLQAYYDEHKSEYEQEASRDIEYVSYDIVPSATDLKKADADITKIFAEYKALDTADIKTYINKTSDDRYDSVYYKKSTLPAQLDSIVFKNKVGTIIGPLFNDYTYTIAKVMDFETRPDSMRASHILVAYAGAMRAPETVTRTKERAKAVADSLLSLIKKNPRLFDTLAVRNSDDAAASRKAGDLDWFTDIDAGGKMIGAFTDACAKNKIGDVKVVETDFGYHIIKVTGKKTFNNKVRLAVIKKKIEPSTETYQTIYAAASSFAGENTTVEQFNSAVAAKKLEKKSADALQPMTNSIAGLETVREIIRWLFDENTKKGDVSKVFDLQKSYVIAYVKEIREKGIAPFEQIKTQIEPLARREKKAVMIIKKINAMKTPGISLEALALKDSAKVDTLDNLTFSSYSIQGYGPEPEILGRLFTMKPGTMSDPLKGKMAVYVINLEKFIDPPPATDYRQLVGQLLQNFKSRVGYELYPILEKKAKVEDNRWMFY